ncbi:hypothetical protein SAMN04488570_1725 [Nocardioides scoriae]|uniref:Pyridoxamine 5'-phosphate oxidase N-terminal domain-containing protein n=1 Tax=Nocardioides scoriae TaxID=642780 RepID=A0A1H1RM05_9ACTN|nr:MSMEG_1061 family FMN-dependent PPOX-type flavoprotein [Nocardioides scoriae]SDS36781.1 hypothetical protein SAMN04488570_1725 [Nocardioides scoriae]
MTVEHELPVHRPRTSAWTEVADVEELEAIVGVPTPAAAHKGRRRLTDLDVAWLRAAPFCVLATSSAVGECDASPKGDPAGCLVHVIDETTLAIAERPGNRRVDGYRNVLQNPQVGLLFMIPGRGDTLRVNGRARLVSEAPFLDEMVVRGHRPRLALVVEVEELFHHCAKSFLRAGLWDPSTWDPEAVVPRRAVVAHALERPETPVAELDAYYGPAYAERVYD